MHIEFLQDFGSWKSGDISDDLKDSIGEGLIAAGQAKRSDMRSFVLQSNQSEMVKMKAEVARNLKEFFEAARPSGSPGSLAVSGPPNGQGQLVETLRTADGFTPGLTGAERECEDLRKNGGGFSRALKHVAMVGKPHLYPPEAVRRSQQVLELMSGSTTEYKFDDDKGTFIEVRRNVLPGGGVETITRTGTDSLSGGSTYGFALKPEYLGNLFEISMEQQVFVNAAQGIPVTQGNEVKWPAWDQYRAPTVANGVTQSAVFAGIQLYYEGESAARVESDANLNMINFKVVDLTGFTALSRDFVRDNHLAFDAALTRMFGRAIGWMEDYMSIQGPGLGKPQGYFNGPSTLVINRANASKISSGDLTAMIAAVSPMVWDELRWLTNITTFPQLSILANSSGTAVFQPNALISQAMKLSMMEKSIGGRGAELMHRPMGDLLGFPVYFTEKVPVLGATGDLSLVAPSQFGVARREGLEMGVSEHFYFTTDLVAYRFKVRHDMKPLWRAPYQQSDGSSTQVSPFVILH